MKFDTRTKIFLFGLLVITPIFQLWAVMDIALVPRFICWSAVLIGGVILFAKDFPKEKYLNWIDASLVVWLLVSAASVLWAWNTAEAVFSTQKVAATMLTYWLLRFLLLKSEGKLIPVLLWCNIAATLLVLAATFWQMSHSPTLFRLAYHSFRDLTGLSAQKNLLCSFLYLTLIFNVFAVFYFRKKTKRIALGGLAVVQIFMLIMLQTRGVYVGLLVSGLFFVVGLQWISAYFNFKKILIAAVVLLMVIGGLWARLNFVDDDFNVYLQKINVTKYLNSNTASERFRLWNNTIDLIQEKPLQGVGAGNWALFFPSQGVENTAAANQNTFFQRPHNDFLWVFSELGILGFLAYVGVFVLTFWLAWKAMRASTSTNEKLQIWVLLSGLVGYVVIANFSFPKERIEHQIWWAMLLAMLAYHARGELKNVRLFTLKINNQVLVALALLVLGFNLTIGYYRYKGEAAMKPVYLEATKQAQKKVLLQKAKSAFYNLDYVGFPMDWYAGIIASNEGQAQQALNYFKEAYAANPYNFRVLTDLAVAHDNLKQRNEAIKYFTKAHQINPQSEDTMFNLSILNYKLKKHKIALEWASKLPENYPRKNELIRELKSKL